MDRNIRDRLYIATVCAEHKEIIDKYESLSDESKKTILDLLDKLK